MGFAFWQGNSVFWEAWLVVSETFKFSFFFFLFAINLLLTEFTHSSAFEWEDIKIQLVHGFLSLKVCTVPGILKRDFYGKHSAMWGIFYRDSDGKVEQGEKMNWHTSHNSDLSIFPSGRRWWTETAGLGQVLDWLIMELTKGKCQTSLRQSFLYLQGQENTTCCPTRLSVRISWHAAPSQVQSRPCEVAGKSILLCDMVT